MHSDCDTDALSLYVDGELSLPRSRALEQHLRTCSSCRVELDHLRQINRVLFTWGAMREPVPLRTEQRINNSLRQRSPWSRLVWLGHVMPAALGTTVAALLVLLTASRGWLPARPATNHSDGRAMAQLIARQTRPLVNERRVTAILPSRNLTATTGPIRHQVQFDIE